jgi:hypothetical protein
MKKRWILIALLAAGCIDDTQVDVSQVIELTPCGADAGTCESVADGRTPVDVEVCVPEAVAVRAANLAATLELSAGRWSVPGPTDAAKPTVTQVALSAQRCAQTSFLTPTTLDPVRIDAQLQGFTVHGDVVLHPAPLDEGTMEVVPQAKLAANVDIPLQVTVRAKANGTPTAGTRVSFVITSVAPATASAAIYPEETVLAGTSATAKLSITGAATAVTVLVTATPPDDPTGMAVAAVHQSVTLTTSP